MSIILTCIAALLFAAGWAAGKVSLLVLWCWSAVAVGWDAARTPRQPELDRGPAVELAEAA